MEFCESSAVFSLHVTVEDLFANTGPSPDKIPKEHRAPRVHTHRVNNRLFGTTDRSRQGKQSAKRHGHNDDNRGGNRGGDDRARYSGLNRHELLL